ncbi:MAG: type II/IV secretion system ATPase subunit [Candidatus Aenigmarchaeota archaeon]|nr:type II/IV secretion system ATPase subunit [Candidatus Aenigmarchaeota archaeon]
MTLVFEHELIDNILRINCLDSIYGFSIEDSDTIMETVIDKILQLKSVERIILAERREYEYDYDQTKLLLEMADTYDKLTSQSLDISKIGGQAGVKILGAAMNQLKIILERMTKRDPIGAYVKIRRMIRQYTSKIKSPGEDKRNRIYYSMFVKNILEPILKELEKTQLIDSIKDGLYGHVVGDRNLYREIFNPLIRPIFMLTRYVFLPPKDGRLVERYELPGGIQVEIYKVPHKVRYYYHITAPEFKLSDDKYTIIDSARRQLAEHKPGEKEFTQPERAREVFMNIGKDMINQMAVGGNYSQKELEEMVNILVRYTAGFGILEILLTDSKLQDIYINSPIGITPIYVQHDDYEECETNLIPTREDAESWATRFRLLSGRPLDEANPVLDTELFVPGGRARVAAITKTLSPEGIAYALRRHRDRPWTYPLFIDTKYMNPLFAGLMSFFVDGSRSILFAGGRSSGKSSLLGATMLEIMKKFRIISLEDTLELPITQLRNIGYNIERMKSRSVITRIESELPADDALRTALRLGDSCLIVGEVRSIEARALFEAMRIGALANVVAGTIHGESPYGVFDRVVNDLGVTATSFKAIDIIVISGMIKSGDGLHRYRRILEVAEVRKHWKDDPMNEKGFVTLMEYSAKDDQLKPTSTLLNGESFVINEISKRVKDWQGNWEAVWDNIELRTKIKLAMVDYARKLNRKDILEAEWVSLSNEVFHMISDEVRKDYGILDSEEIYKRWDEWFRNYISEKNERRRIRQFV